MRKQSEPQRRRYFTGYKGPLSIHRILTKSDREFLKGRREEVAKTWKNKVENEWATVTKTAQKKNKRQVSRIYEGTHNIWLFTKSQSSTK